MKLYDKNHPHNAVFCEQLQSVIDGKPKTAEYNVGDGVWHELPMNEQGVSLAKWLVSYDYRINPPEPVSENRWNGDKIYLSALQQGRAFTTKADAQACWNALVGAQK